MTLQEQIAAFGKENIIKVCEDNLVCLMEDQDWLFNRINQVRRDIVWADTDDMKMIFAAFEAKLKAELNRCRKDIRWWQSKIDLVLGDKKQLSYDLEQIKQIPIIQFLGEYSMKSSTRVHYKAPWRNETKASLVVYTQSNTWWDFGASIGGSNIDFIMKKEGLDFIESVKYLKSYL